MSNVKEAYELIFVDGTRFPEVVLNSMAGDPILGFPFLISASRGDAPYLVTGNDPRQIDHLNPDWTSLPWEHRAAKKTI